MGAIKEAIALYGADNFSRLHGLYAEHGYCYSEPSLLILARPCDSKDYTCWVGRDEADAWWIELLIGEGSARAMFDKAPFPLPKVGWRRDFKGGHYPRFYNFQRLKEKF